VPPRQSNGKRSPRIVTSCDRCLAWGLIYAQGVCQSCYNFSNPIYGHLTGECLACHRVQPLKNGYCRSCWCQAAADRLAADSDSRSRVMIAPHLPRVRFHQTFLVLPARRTPPPRTAPRRWGTKGRPLKPAPPPTVRPATVWLQQPLFGDEGLRRYRYAEHDLRSGPPPDNPWLAWALHIAHTHAQVRGWSGVVQRGIQRALVMLLAAYQPPDRIRVSDFSRILVPRAVSTDLIVEILGQMEIVHDDRSRAFDLWLADKAADLPSAIREDVIAWCTEFHDGGPRTRPRPDAASSYLRIVLPALHGWADRYHHLREVTRADVVAHVSELSGRPRAEMTTALRALFGWAKRTKRIFRNPTAGVRSVQPEVPLWQPLPDTAIAECVEAADTPQARLWVALAAIHAARPGAIRRIQLDEVDLANWRITIGGIDRPLDPTTYQLVVEWLDHRRRTWPTTANRHLFISRESALRHGPVSATWILDLRGSAATLEQLRIDRQLDEAIVTGGDPLHLAEVFGIDSSTAVRYAANARQLLATAVENEPAVPLEPKDS
jgi:integrase